MKSVDQPGWNLPVFYCCLFSVYLHVPANSSYTALWLFFFKLRLAVYRCDGRGLYWSDPSASKKNGSVCLYLFPISWQRFSDRVVATQKVWLEWHRFFAGRDVSLIRCDHCIWRRSSRVCSLTKLLLLLHLERVNSKRRRHGRHLFVEYGKANLERFFSFCPRKFLTGAWINWMTNQKSTTKENGVWRKQGGFCTFFNDKIRFLRC